MWSSSATMPKDKMKKGTSIAELYPTGNSTGKKAMNGPSPEDSDSNEQGNSADLLKCDVCTSTVEYIVQYEWCKKWHCCACGIVSECPVAILDEFKELHWLCQHCDKAVMDIINTPDSETLVTGNPRQGIQTA